MCSIESKPKLDFLNQKLKRSFREDKIMQLDQMTVQRFFFMASLAAGWSDVGAAERTGEVEGWRQRCGQPGCHR